MRGWAPRVSAANILSGGGYGIDARGSWGTAICGNHVSNSATGIAAGGCQNVFVSGNVLLTNSWAVLVSAIEPTLSALPTGPLSLAGNWIGFTSPQGGRDPPAGRGAGRGRGWQ